MQNNKTTHRWLDVQIVIITIAMTFILALWNLFAGGGQVNNANTRSSAWTIFPPSSPSTQNNNTWPAPSNSGSPVLLGGSAPSNAPSPFTITSSSRP